MAHYGSNCPGFSSKLSEFCYWFPPGFCRRPQWSPASTEQAEDPYQQRKTAWLRDDADFTDGFEEVEASSVSPAGPNALKNAIENAAEKPGNPQIVIHARNVNISAADAAAEIQRAEGNIAVLLGRITVLTQSVTAKG